MARGQASSEYIIILAVVLILALVAVAVLGGFIDVGGGMDDDTSKAYWRTSAGPEVGILNWEVDQGGTFLAEIRNNADYSIRLEEFLVDGSNVLDDVITLPVGARQVVCGETTAGVGTYALPARAVYKSLPYQIPKDVTGREPVVGRYVSEQLECPDIPFFPPGACLTVGVDEGSGWVDTPYYTNLGNEDVRPHYNYSGTGCALSEWRINDEILYYIWEHPAGNYSLVGGFDKKGPQSNGGSNLGLQMDTSFDALAHKYFLDDPSDPAHDQLTSTGGRWEWGDGCSDGVILTADELELGSECMVLNVTLVSAVIQNISVMDGGVLRQLTTDPLAPVRFCPGCGTPQLVTTTSTSTSSTSTSTSTSSTSTVGASPTSTTTSTSTSSSSSSSSSSTSTSSTSSSTSSSTTTTAPAGPVGAQTCSDWCDDAGYAGWICEAGNCGVTQHGNDKLDLVFILDTSGSMGPYWTSLCDVVDGVITDLNSQGYDVQDTVYGLSGTRAEATCLDYVAKRGSTPSGDWDMGGTCCFSTWMCNEIGDRESWAPAVIWAAYGAGYTTYEDYCDTQYFFGSYLDPRCNEMWLNTDTNCGSPRKHSWRSDVAKAIVVVSDICGYGSAGEAPCGFQCDCDGEDNIYVTGAINAAVAGDIKVYPWKVSSETAVRDKKDELASGTGGTSYDWGSISSQLDLTIEEIIRSGASGQLDCNSGEVCCCS